MTRCFPGWTFLLEHSAHYLNKKLARLITSCRMRIRRTRNILELAWLCWRATPTSSAFPCRLCPPSAQTGRLRRLQIIIKGVSKIRETVSLPVLRRKDEKRALGWHWFVVVDAVGQGRSGFVAGPACVRCHTNSSVVFSQRMSTILEWAELFSQQNSYEFHVSWPPLSFVGSN